MRGKHSSPNIYFRVINYRPCLSTVRLFDKCQPRPTHLAHLQALQALQAPPALLLLHPIFPALTVLGLRQIKYNLIFYFRVICYAPKDSVLCSEHSQLTSADFVSPMLMLSARHHEQLLYAGSFRSSSVTSDKQPILHLRVITSTYSTARKPPTAPPLALHELFQPAQPASILSFSYLWKSIDIESVYCYELLLL